MEKVAAAVDSSNKPEHQRQEEVVETVVERAADFQKSTAVVVQVTDTMWLHLLVKVVVVRRCLAEVCHVVMDNP